MQDEIVPHKIIWKFSVRPFKHLMLAASTSLHQSLSWSTFIFVIFIGWLVVWPLRHWIRCGGLLQLGRLGKCFGVVLGRATGLIYNRYTRIVDNTFLLLHYHLGVVIFHVYLLPMLPLTSTVQYIKSTKESGLSEETIRCSINNA